MAFAVSLLSDVRLVLIGAQSLAPFQVRKLRSRVSPAF